jgi:hypothetical protein
MSAAVVPVVGAAVIGCNPQWWQNFTSNPEAQVSAFEQGVQVALNEAAVAWSVVLPFIPAPSVAQITQQYQNAVFAVNHAMALLNDAVNAAIAAQQSNPDFTALMAAVTDAISQVLAIIQQYSSSAPQTVDGGVAPAPAPGVAAKPANPYLYEAQAQVTKLKSGRYGVKH